MSLSESPFDLPVLELRLQLRWREPVRHPYPSVGLLKWLRSRLWRQHCTRARQRHVACADTALSGAMPACSSPQGCLANCLIPLPGSSASHDSAKVWLVPVSHASSSVNMGQFRLRLVGRQADQWLGPVASALRDLGRPGHSDWACQIDWLDEARYTVADRATQLSAFRAWRVETLTPWRAARNELGLATAPQWQSHWLSALPRQLAQRAYRFVALDLQDRGMAGLPTQLGSEAHAVALAARDHGALPILTLLRTSHPSVRRIARNSHLSRSTDKRFDKVEVQGSFTWSAALSSAQARSAGGWLAVAELMGLGADTSEGYGAVQVTGVDTSPASGPWV